MSENLEIDIDPYDGRMIPCAMCMAAPQVGGTGVCSEECSDAIREWMEEDSNDSYSDNYSGAGADTDACA